MILPMPDIQSKVAEISKAARTPHVEPSKPTPPPSPVKPVQATTAPSNDVWWRLAGCESGHRNLRGRTYSGYFQFSGSTWRAMGESGVAADHSYATQRAVAIRLQARAGWNQWPSCSRQLGLR